MRRLGWTAAIGFLAACTAHAPSSLPRVTSADGIAIHYVDEGHGPAVVMLHCLGCNLHYWDVAAADLARDHRVVRIDFPGHGESGTGRTSWTIEAFAHDVGAVVNTLGIDRFTLVGHSMSGTIALETAVELGDRVKGVVPIDSVVDVDAHVPPEMRASIVAKIRTDYLTGLDEQIAALMPKPPHPDVVTRVRADARAKDPAQTAAILDSVLAYREDQALDRLKMPIIAIDSDVRPLALDHNRAHAPQFDARVIPGTGHWLMLDKPAEFTATLRSVVVAIERIGTSFEQ